MMLRAARATVQMWPKKPVPERISDHGVRVENFDGAADLSKPRGSGRFVRPVCWEMVPQGKAARDGFQDSPAYL